MIAAHIRSWRIAVELLKPETERPIVRRTHPTPTRSAAVRDSLTTGQDVIAVALWRGSTWRLNEFREIALPGRRIRYMCTRGLRLRRKRHGRMTKASHFRGRSTHRESDCPYRESAKALVQDRARERQRIGREGGERRHGRMSN